MNIKLQQPCPDCKGKADPLCGKCFGTGVIETDWINTDYSELPIMDNGKQTGKRIICETTIKEK